MTLLAFVNGTPINITLGAGDLVAAFVASTQLGGISYNVGAIYGAGLFVTSMVVGCVILGSSDTIRVNPKGITYPWILAFIRDISTYIVGTLVVLAFGFYGELNLFAGILLLCMYGLLVVYVAVDEYVRKKTGQKTED